MLELQISSIYDEDKAAALALIVDPHERAAAIGKAIREAKIAGAMSALCQLSGAAVHISDQPRGGA